MGWKPTSGGGGDPDAIHVNVPDEINQIPSKSTPVAADVLVIEDSADSWEKKSIAIDDLPGVGGAVDVEDSGTPVAAADTLNFGSNLAVVNDGGGKVTINASGGGGGGAESFDDVLADYAGSLVHSWYMDVGSGNVPDLTGSLDLTTTGAGSPFNYGITSPFGAATAMEVPVGGNRYLESSGLGNIPVGAADRTILSFFRPAADTPCQCYGYGTNVNTQDFTLTPRTATANQFMFNQWGPANDMPILPLSVAGLWTMAAHGIQDGRPIGVAVGQWRGTGPTQNTATGGNFQAFRSPNLSQNQAGFQIARIYVWPSWLGREAVERFSRAWMAMGGS